MERRLQDPATPPEASQPVSFPQSGDRAGLFTEAGVVAQQSFARIGGDGPRSRARALLLRIPPPLVAVVAFLLGVGLQRLVPVPLPARVEVPLQLVGAVVLVPGVLLGPVNALMFLLRRTTLDPARAPRRLFTGGVYRITRNPMYIGLLLVYAGVALLHAQAWALLLVAVPVVLVDRIYIPFEEQQLAATFGPEYLAYCRRVRRWLGARSATPQRPRNR